MEAGGHGWDAFPLGRRPLRHF